MGDGGTTTRHRPDLSHHPRSSARRVLDSCGRDQRQHAVHSLKSWSGWQDSNLQGHNTIRLQTGEASIYLTTPRTEKELGRVN